MTTTEKIMTWGLLAVIAYELWQSAPVSARGGLLPVDPSSKLPIWAQQLAMSEGVYGGSAGGYSTTTVEDLMSLPQGPGGTIQDPTANYLDTLSALCRNKPLNMLTNPTVQRMA
jgi:hypothetical protein